MRGVFNQYGLMSCIQPLYVITMLVFTLQVHATDIDTCAICQKDHYCSGGSMNECPFASESAESSTLRTECICKSGYFGTIAESGGTCDSCPENTYCGGGAQNEGCFTHAISPRGSTSKSDCTCSEGYYEESDGNCELCPSGSYCVGDGYKKECPDKTTTEDGATQESSCSCISGNSGSRNGVECTPCVPGKYKVDGGIGTCTPCPVNTYSSVFGSNSQENCLSCPLNSVSDKGKTGIQDCKCGPGFFGDDGATCKQCTEGTYKSQRGSADCTPCAVDTYSTILGATTSDVCEACPTNTASPKGSDQLVDCRCEPGFTADENGVICTSCKAGTFKSDAGTSSCTQCNEDTFSQTLKATTVDTCQACPSGSFSQYGSSALEDCICSPGYFGSATSQCSPCPTGTTSPQSGMESCTDCGVGTYQPNEAYSGECIDCPSHSSSSVRSGTLQHCQCIDGYKGDVNNCVKCTSGFFCTGGVEYACPINANSLEMSDHITDCKCMPGYHGDIRADDDDTPCQMCTADFYCSGEHFSSMCPNNSSSLEGSAEITDCMCDGGFQGEPGGPCEICPVDTYCNTGTLSICPVHSASIRQSDSASDCSCLAGYFGVNGGECEVCFENKFCLGGEETNNCPEHSVSLSGSKSSTDCICKPGWYQSGSVCLSCPVDHFCHAGEVNACPAGTTSTANSKKVQSCECKAGYTGNSDAIECHSCAIGTYKQNTGEGACSVCTENTYSITSASDSITDCLACPDTTTSTEGSDMKTSCICKPGYYGNSGTDCAACPTGTYKQKAGDSDCIPCPVDTFQDQTGQMFLSSCKVCPDNSKSELGSGLYTDCGCVSGYYDKHPESNLFR
jgi:hypothetical protein